MNLGQTIAWDASVGAVDYRVIARDGANQLYGVEVVTAGLSVPVADVITGSAALDTYTFFVYPRDSAGNEGSPGTVQATLVAPDAPLNVRVQ
jgi:hypothetical protein